MQNKSEKMIGKFQQKYQFWDGFGKGFGRVWEGLEGIKIRWKKDVNIRGRGAQVPIAALGHDLYRGGLGHYLDATWKNPRIWDHLIGHLLGSSWATFSHFFAFFSHLWRILNHHG